VAKEILIFGFAHHKTRAKFDEQILGTIILDLIKKVTNWELKMIKE
jgi:hypothetical protein